MSSAMTDLNSTDLRTDIPGEVFPEGDLPTFGGGRQTIPPGEDKFKLPLDLRHLWHVIKNDETMIKFDRDNPLIIVGGPHDGQPMTASFTSFPWRRGKVGETAVPVVSEVSYFLELGLGDKTRPHQGLQGTARIEAIKQAVNKHAGKVITLKHGLSGQCNKTKVRYIFKDPKDETNTQTMQDPTGQMGCGAKYYTRDFMKPYAEVIPCRDCVAAIKGFESVDWAQ